MSQFIPLHACAGDGSAPAGDTPISVTHCVPNYPRYTPLTSDLMISFEVMPARTEKAAAAFPAEFNQLLSVRPDFVSVTYGAGGKDRSNARSLVRHIVTDTPTHPIAHFTTVCSSREEICEIITDYLDDGVRTFLALRGDNPIDQPDWTPGPDGVRSAAELISLIKLLEARRVAQHPGYALRQAIRPLTIAVATFLGGNPAAGTTAEQEADNLLVKQEAGAGMAITQLFWEPDLYPSFVELARARGVHIPIVPGVLPPVSAARVKKVGELTGLHAPQWLFDRLAHADNPQQEGISIAADLVRQLVDFAAPGIHTYTFNKAAPALSMLSAAGLVREELTEKQRKLGSV